MNNKVAYRPKNGKIIMNPPTYKLYCQWKRLNRIKGDNTLLRRSFINDLVIQRKVRMRG